ncbi:hypothetical protein [Halalkalicoccus salilacus]
MFRSGWFRRLGNPELSWLSGIDRDGPDRFVGTATVRYLLASLAMLLVTF